VSTFTFNPYFQQPRQVQTAEFRERHLKSKIVTCSDKIRSTGSRIRQNDVCGLFPKVMKKKCGQKTEGCESANAHISRQQHGDKQHLLLRSILGEWSEDSNTAGQGRREALGTMHIVVAENDDDDEAEGGANTES
jgi:hypothetical protein